MLTHAIDRILSDEDYAAAAVRLGIDEALIRTVAEVEAPRGGFLSDGRVTILFERHVFYRELKRTGRKPEDYMLPSNFDILWPRPGGYRGGVHEHERLARARAINDGAALRSASWGRFQIMGFNRAECGFDSIYTFVDAMKRHERDHLAAFLALVSSWGLISAMRTHDWRAFAEKYNGPGNVDVYSARLSAAYERFA